MVDVCNCKCELESDADTDEHQTHYCEVWHFEIKAQNHTRERIEAQKCGDDQKTVKSEKLFKPVDVIGESGAQSVVDDRYKTEHKYGGGRHL